MQRYIVKNALSRISVSTKPFTSTSVPLSMTSMIRGIIPAVSRPVRFSHTNKLFTPSITKRSSYTKRFNNKEARHPKNKQAPNNNATTPPSNATKSSSKAGITYNSTPTQTPALKASAIKVFESPHAAYKSQAETLKQQLPLHKRGVKPPGLLGFLDQLQEIKKKPWYKAIYVLAISFALFQLYSRFSNAETYSHEACHVDTPTSECIERSFSKAFRIIKQKWVSWFGSDSDMELLVASLKELANIEDERIRQQVLSAVDMEQMIVPAVTTELQSISQHDSEATRKLEQHIATHHTTITTTTPTSPPSPTSDSSPSQAV